MREREGGGGRGREGEGGRGREREEGRVCQGSDVHSHCCRTLVLDFMVDCLPMN